MTEFFRGLTATAWAAIVTLLLALALLSWCAASADSRRIVKVEARASPAREVAADERQTDTQTIETRQQERDNAAEAIPVACLIIVSLGAAVASCETPGAAPPSASDLRVQPKPVPSDNVLTSRIAGEQYDNAVEARGEAGWAQVGRHCRFFGTLKMKNLDCPPPPRPG